MAVQGPIPVEFAHVFPRGVFAAGPEEGAGGVRQGGGVVAPAGDTPRGAPGGARRAGGAMAPADDADIALGDAIGGGDRAAADQEVETLGICLAHSHLS